MPVPQFHRRSYTPKVVFRAAFTPENDSIVFSAATEANRPELFEHGPEYPTARRVGLPAGTHLLAVSRNGELALLVDASIVTSDVLRGTLARMPIGAVAPRVVLNDVRDADWSPDGTDLAIVRAAGEKDRVEFPAGRVLYETAGYLSDLHVSPDGLRLAMFEHRMKWEDRASLIVVDREGRKTVIGDEYPSAHGLAWRPDGSEIVFSASMAGRDNTGIFAATPGGRLRQVLADSGSLTVHDVSATGRYLITRDERRVGIRALTAGDTTERELSWLDRSEAAAMSENGHTLLFTERARPAGSGGAVCLRGTDGSAVVSLGAGVAQDLSPDGRWALALGPASAQLLLYPTGVGDKRVLPQGPIEAYRWASWFPDGQRILACGTERGRSARCYVQDVNGTAPRPVTPGGEWGIVSPDGQRVVAWRPEAPPVIYRLNGSGASESIPGVTAEDVPIRWTAAGNGLLVYKPQQLPGRIERIDLVTGLREVRRQFSPPDRVGLLSLDPVLVTEDASSYVYTYTRVVSTLFVVDGVR